MNKDAKLNLTMIYFTFFSSVTDKHTSHYGNVQYNRMNIISDDNVEFTGFLAVCRVKCVFAPQKF